MENLSIKCLRVSDMQTVTKDYAIDELCRLSAWLAYIAEALKENDLPCWAGIKELSEDLEESASSLDSMHKQILLYVHNQD